MPKRLDTPEARERNRVYQNGWYHSNKASALATRQRRRDKLTAIVREVKADAGCRRCGERDPICLDFHHPDPSQKDLNPMELVRRRGWSIDRLLAEIALLEILCANCHRKVHHEWFLLTGSRTTPPEAS